ncbi:MAG: hypothetical protein Q8P39_01770 [Candidatus Yanofskybacteria bacterium]|nr:hypothetical protein [Candidatus Yanofskybacteria bacterium]
MTENEQANKEMRQEYSCCSRGGGTKVSESIKKYNTRGVWQIVSGALAVMLVFSALSDMNVERFEKRADRGQARALFETVIPAGIPNVYGAELGVSYDDVGPGDPRLADLTIRTLGQLDLELELAGNDLERYISILYHQHNGMSCEYCCGARSVLFENGTPACGCAHSYAMRGLAKYLILEHGENMADKEILEEIGKWKVLFFPEIHEQKAVVMRQLGMTVDYISMTANINRGIERGAALGSMVGDC